MQIKGKQKRMVLFIRIEVYYWILPNKSQTKIKMSTCKRFGFSNFKIWHTLHEFSRKPTIFDKFYFYQRKGGPNIILSKENHAVFIFHFFMNLQWQNVTNVTVTYVTNISVESFWNHCSSVIWTCLIILQNCYFSELAVKCSLENNSLKHRSVLV